MTGGIRNKANHGLVIEERTVCKGCVPLRTVLLFGLAKDYKLTVVLIVILLVIFLIVVLIVLVVLLILVIVLVILLIVIVVLIIVHSFHLLFTRIVSLILGKLY